MSKESAVRNNIWKWLVLLLIAVVSFYVTTPVKDKLRFGLDDGRPRTLEEVGQEFNITRERIRQIEAKALRKLRHPSRSKMLKEYRR